VVASSFARTFYRTAINDGLLIFDVQRLYGGRAGRRLLRIVLAEQQDPPTTNLAFHSFQIGEEDPGARGLANYLKTQLSRGLVGDVGRPFKAAGLPPAWSAG